MTLPFPCCRHVAMRELSNSLSRTALSSSVASITKLPSSNFWREPFRPLVFEWPCWPCDEDAGVAKGVGGPAESGMGCSIRLSSSCASCFRAMAPNVCRSSTGLSSGHRSPAAHPSMVRQIVRQSQAVAVASERRVFDGLERCGVVLCRDESPFIGCRIERDPQHAAAIEVVRFAKHPVVAIDGRIQMSAARPDDERSHALIIVDRRSTVIVVVAHRVGTPELLVMMIVAGHQDSDARLIKRGADVTRQ